MAETETMDVIVVDTPQSNPPSSPLSSPLSSPAVVRKRSIDDMKQLKLQEAPSKKAKNTDSEAAAAKNKALQDPAKKLEKGMKEKEKEIKRLDKEARDKEKELKRLDREAKEKERKREKEEKEREKEAKKAEIEKEREAKKAEIEEKKRQREDEKRKKEEEKRKIEEEKKKKEGQQLKIAGFFKKPPADATNPPPKTQRTVAISETKVIPVPDSGVATDYEKEFYPFFVKPNVELAPTPFARDEACRRTITTAIDESLAAEKAEDSMDVDGVAPVRGGVTKEEIAVLLHMPPTKLNRRKKPFPYTTKDILARINAPDDPGLPPLHTNPKKPHGGYTSTFYLELLKTLPTKTLKFAEDVRPPYTGTYTRKPASSGLRTGRNPFDRTLPGVNYDYDSEAEWVADEEGEDLESEDEEDKDSVGDEDDLDGFLDDEEDDGLKRGGHGAPVLVATNSGMCWEKDGKQERPDLEGMRMELLIDNIAGPIDPWSTSYWKPHVSPKPKTTTAMDPPSRPANPLKRTVAMPTATSPLPASDANKKMVPPEDLHAFKAAIDGSDMTKAGLIEVLKKTFPKIPKEAIKNTVGMVAERVGDNSRDKRWVLK